MISNGNSYSNGGSSHSQGVSNNLGEGTEQESLLWQMLLRTMPPER